MTPEEQLDRLIERRERGIMVGPVVNREIAARLEAAERLEQLQAIEVPPEFAARLERQLRTRLRYLAQEHGGEIAVPRPQRRVRPRQLFLNRAWMTALGIAAVLLLMCISAISAAAQSLPDDPLYSLKQLEQQVTLALASNPQGHVQVEIDQLRKAMSDLETVVHQQRADESVSQALGVVATRTRESQAAVLALPAGADRVAAQRDLDDALTTENQTLRALLPQLDWPLRLAFTQQLGALNNAIPTITHVTVNIPQKGTILITVTGTNFLPGASLIINGVSKGTVQQITPTQIVALINTSDWPKGARAVGVLNPDGTAAQLQLKGDDNDNDNDDNQSSPTPGATSTPGDDSEDDGNGLSNPGGSPGTVTPTSDR